MTRLPCQGQTAARAIELAVPWRQGPHGVSVASDTEPAEALLQTATPLTVRCCTPRTTRRARRRRRGRSSPWSSALPGRRSCCTTSRPTTSRPPGLLVAMASKPRTCTCEAQATSPLRERPSARVEAKRHAWKRPWHGSAIEPERRKAPYVQRGDCCDASVHGPPSVGGVAAPLPRHVALQLPRVGRVAAPRGRRRVEGARGGAWPVCCFVCGVGWGGTNV